EARGRAPMLARVAQPECFEGAVHFEAERRVGLEPPDSGVAELAQRQLWKGHGCLHAPTLRCAAVSSVSGLICMRRTERLFAMAEYLRGRRTGVTAEALAERFGVTVRTVYRDLDSLRDASLPLLAERGRGGGYALDKAYSLPPVNFTSREAAVLV